MVIIQLNETRVNVRYGLKMHAFEEDENTSDTSRVSLQILIAPYVRNTCSPVLSFLANFSCVTSDGWCDQKLQTDFL